MIDIRLLLQFAAVGECCSFTEAARQLGMGQPRLSAQIRKLEDLFGSALFERSTRRVELTARGQQLLTLVRPLASSARQTLEEVAALRLETAGTVRIGCPQLGAPDQRQASLFGNFMRDHPGIALDVQPGLSVHHADQLRSGELDLALMSIVPPGAQWETAQLHRLELAAILHRADPLCEVAVLNAHHLRGRRVAVFPKRRAPDLYERLYAPLEEAGAILLEVPELRRSLLHGRPELIVSTIVAAPAEASLPHELCRRPVATSGEMRMQLVRMRGSVRPSAAERFWNWAQSELGEASGCTSP